MMEGATGAVMEEEKAAGDSVRGQTVAEGSAAADSEVGSAAADSEAVDPEAAEMAVVDSVAADSVVVGPEVETEEEMVVDSGAAPVVEGKGGSSAPTQ